MASTTTHLPRFTLMGSPAWSCWVILRVASVFSRVTWVRADGSQRTHVGVIGCTRYLPCARAKSQRGASEAQQTALSCGCFWESGSAGELATPITEEPRLELPEEAMPEPRYSRTRYLFF